MNNSQSINELTAANLSLLQEYDKLTDRMISADLEVVREVLLGRQRLLDQIEENRERIALALGAMPEQRRLLLQSIIQGDTLRPDTLDDDTRQLQSLQQAMRGIWGGISRKDQTVYARIDGQMNELKGSLREMQKDRKLVQYYNSLSVKKTGKKLDSHT